MFRKAWFSNILIVLGLGVALHGLVTDTGPVGWLNAFQQRHFGSYVSELSFVVVALSAWVAGLLLAWLASKLLGPGTTRLEAPLPPARNAGSPVPQAREGRVWGLPAPLVLIAFTWIAGGALYGWHVLKLHQDAQATYQQVDLTDGVPLPTLASNHLALRGFPEPDLGVVFKSGAVEDYRLIAMVGLGWEPNHAVPVVVKLDAGESLPDQGLPPGWLPRGPEDIQLLVRRLGAVPTPALQAFRDMQAPLADTVLMVSAVAAQNGRPILPDTTFDRVFTLVACSLISLAVLAWAGVRKLRRRGARRKAHQV